MLRKPGIGDDNENLLLNLILIVAALVFCVTILADDDFPRRVAVAVRVEDRSVVVAPTVAVAAAVAVAVAVAVAGVTGIVLRGERDVVVPGCCSAILVVGIIGAIRVCAAAAAWVSNAYSSSPNVDRCCCGIGCDRCGFVSVGTGIVTDDRFDADTGIVTDDRFDSVGTGTVLSRLLLLRYV